MYKGIAYIVGKLVQYFSYTQKDLYFTKHSQKNLGHNSVIYCFIFAFNKEEISTSGTFMGRETIVREGYNSGRGHMLLTQRVQIAKANGERF